MNTLALAQYRVGRYQDALGTVARGAKMRTSPNLTDTVVSVLARLRLGQVETARVDLDRMLTAKDPGQNLRLLINEAKAVSDWLQRKR